MNPKTLLCLLTVFLHFYAKGSQTTSFLLSEHIDIYGNVLAHFDDNDNCVYLHQNGIVDNHGIKIGELGKKIDLSMILDRKLQMSSIAAKKISNHSTIFKYLSFSILSKTNGVWDLKNNKSTIWGVAWNHDQIFGTKTVFTSDLFNNASAADIGNFHYGFVGTKADFGRSMLLFAAGAAEVWKSLKERNPNFRERLFQLLNPACEISGDNPSDYLFDTMGIRYATPCSL